MSIQLPVSTRFFDRALASRVVKISLPMVISELSNSIYALTDTYFVSGLGTSALAGVGLGSYLSWLFFVVLSMFYNGVLIYIAQAYGAGKLDEARQGLSETLTYGLAIVTLVALAGYGVGGYILALQAGGYTEVWAQAYLYFRIRMLGLPISLLVWSMDAALRGIGATKQSMYVNLYSVMINIVLDPLLIYGYLGFPRMGVAGAAVATIISIALMIPAETYYLRKHSIFPTKIYKPEKIMKILDLGTPVMIERLIFSAGNNIYISVISRCGDAALAAHNIGIRIESLIYMPGFAFSMTASTLVGQEIGAGRNEKGKKIGYEAIKIGVLFMSITGIIVALTAKYITKPFSPTPQVNELATLYLTLAGLSEPGLALAMIIGGAIRGAGNTRIPLFINAGCLYFTRIIPSMILVNYLGVLGPWLSMFIDVYIRGIIFLIVYTKYFDKLVRKIV